MAEQHVSAMARSYHRLSSRLLHRFLLCRTYIVCWLFALQQRVMHIVVVITWPCSCTSCGCCFPLLLPMARFLFCCAAQLIIPGKLAFCNIVAALQPSTLVHRSSTINTPRPGL